MNFPNVLKDLFDQLAGRDEQPPARPARSRPRVQPFEMRRPLETPIGVVSDLVNQLRSSTSKPKKPPAQAWIPPTGEFYTGSIVEGRRSMQRDPQGNQQEVTTPVFGSRIYDESDPDERANQRRVRKQFRN